MKTISILSYSFLVKLKKKLIFNFGRSFLLLQRNHCKINTFVVKLKNFYHFIAVHNSYVDLK